MKKTINFYEFCDEFNSMNRENNFSYAGKRALFDYLEDYENECNTEIELDVIAICCEYTEYSDVEEFISNHGNKYSPDKPERDDFNTEEEYQEELEEYEETLQEKTLEKLQDHTQVIYVGGTSFIVQDF